MSYDKERLDELLSKMGMKAELVRGISGVPIAYRISKDFTNRKKAVAWCLKVAECFKVK